MKDLAPPQFKWKNSQGMSFNVFLISIDIKHQKRKKKNARLNSKDASRKITEFSDYRATCWSFISVTFDFRL